MGSVRDRVIAAIADQLGNHVMLLINCNAGYPNGGDKVNIFEDLGADNIDICNIVFELEEEFQIIIPDEKKFSTVGDLVKLVEEMIKEDAKAPEQGIDPTQFDKDALWEDQKLDDFQALFAQILNENSRQLKKWGVQKYDVFTWHAILAEEVGELAKAMLEYKFGSKVTTTEEIHKEAIQVATLAMKIAEMAALK